MESINVNEIRLVPSWHDGKEEAKWASCLPFTPMFPTWSGIESKKSTLVYFEIEPGNELGEHSDSEEELLLIFDGNVEATIAGETSQASKGIVIVIPALVPIKYEILVKRRLNALDFSLQLILATRLQKLFNRSELVYFLQVLNIFNWYNKRRAHLENRVCLFFIKFIFKSTFNFTF